MHVSVREKTSISGKITEQKVVFYIKGLQRLYMVPAAQGNGEWFTRFGCATMRWKMKEWLQAEFGTEKPPFEIVVERVKSLNPPPPPNTKARPWLR